MTNPAGLKATMAAAQARDEAMPQAGIAVRIVRRAAVPMISILTPLLLILSFAPYDQWYLGFVTLVGWVVLLGLRPRGRLPILWATLAGVVFWSASLYWLWWITLEGYAAAAAYLSVYWLVAAVVVRAAMRRGLPAWIALPVVWVALEYARAFVISGFPWFYLAHSQWTRPTLIQIADTTGQYGVSFLVAMVNGLLADIVLFVVAWRRSASESPIATRDWRVESHDSESRIAPGAVPNPRSAIRNRLLVGACATLLLAGGTIGYGVFRLGQQVHTPGPSVGLVQGSYPIALGKPSATDSTRMKHHLDRSEAFIGLDLGLVIWPETMAPRGINHELWGIDFDSLSSRDLRSLGEKFGARPGELTDQQLRKALKMGIGDLPREVRPDCYRVGQHSDMSMSLRCYAEDIARLSRRVGCPVLVGAPTVRPNPNPTDDADRWGVWNSSLLFDREPIPVAQYDKVQLVPFSEYVPFKHSLPAAYQVLRGVVPPVMEQLEPGTRYTVFTISADGKTYRLATPICYEGTFDRVCRRMVFQDGHKSVDILVNMSNDGWFVWKSDPGRGSNEHSQHLAQYAFRAVENRVPVVRAVNTGISASFDSNGRLVAVVDHYGRREAVAGALVLKDGVEGTMQYGAGPSVLVDGRTSVYSRAGDAFAMAVSLAALGMCGWLIVRRLRRRRDDHCSIPVQDRGRE